MGLKSSIKTSGFTKAQFVFQSKNEQYFWGTKETYQKHRGSLRLNLFFRAKIRAAIFLGLKRAHGSLKRLNQGFTRAHLKKARLVYKEN